MELLNTLDKAREAVLGIIKDPSLTHEQTMMKLAKAAENILPYPEGTPEEFYQLYDEGLICDLS